MPNIPTSVIFMSSEICVCPNLAKFSPFYYFVSQSTWLNFSLKHFVTMSQLLADGEITPGITNEEYISRRKKLLEVLPEKSLAIIASAEQQMMTDVVPYPFRQNGDYLYITGCTQPGGIAVLSEETGLCMFMPDKNKEVMNSYSDTFSRNATQFLLLCYSGRM